MLSSRYRWAKIAALAVALAALCWHSYAHNPEFTFWECQAAPDRCDGQEIEVINNPVAGSLTGDGFILLQLDHRIPVVGAVAGLREGEDVSLRAVYHRQGYLELREARVSKLRTVRKLVSLSPLLIVAWLIGRRYRFDFRRGLLVER